MNKKSNLQELYENLVDNRKKLILFGVGQQVRRCIEQINIFLSIVYDNWKTPEYIDDKEKDTYLFNNIVDFIEFAVDNSAEKVKKEYFNIEGKKIKIYSSDVLNRVDKEKYVILITTKLYENEIKCQLKEMDELSMIEYYGFFSDLQHYRKKNRGLIVERVIIPYMELIRQPYYQKNREISDKDEYRRLLEFIGDGKYINNIIGFEISTVCNLRCENCADYIPRLSKHGHVPTETILRDIDIFFDAVDLVFCVTLVSGEVLFHPGIKEILSKLILLDKVERIDLVTNGVRYPEDEELLKLLANNKIMVHMSNYDMPEKTDISRAFYLSHGIDLRFMSDQIVWEKIASRLYNRKYNKEELEQIYLKCSIARYCPQIIREGKIYLCGRAIRFAQLSAYSSEHDYRDILNKKGDNIKEELRDFKLEPYMEACNWCDWTEMKAYVQPGVQQG